MGLADMSTHTAHTSLGGLSPHRRITEAPRVHVNQPFLEVRWLTMHSFRGSERGESGSAQGGKSKDVLNSFFPDVQSVQKLTGAGDGRL